MMLLQASLSQLWSFLFQGEIESSLGVPISGTMFGSKKQLFYILRKSVSGAKNYFLLVSGQFSTTADFKKSTTATDCQKSSLVCLPRLKIQKLAPRPKFAVANRLMVAVPAN